jgi:hypothetical protein
MKVKATLAAVSVALFGAALCGATAQAGSLVDVEVLARGYRGAALPSYWFQGETYVEGRQGQEFRVRLRNKSSERVLAVLSVDGVNAISGETAGLNQTGYVLAPYQTLDVDGWRKSSAQTAAFYFTHIADSYGARTGRPDNVGVIGAAVFREQRYNAYGYDGESYDELARQQQPYAGRDKSVERRAASPTASAPAESRAESKSNGIAQDGGFGAGAPIGTGHGRREYRPSVDVEFAREDAVFEVNNVRYDSRQNLLAAGVIPQRGWQRSVPQSFPQGGGYVPDPDYSMSAPYRTRRW